MNAFGGDMTGYPASPPPPVHPPHSDGDRREFSTKIFDLYHYLHSTFIPVGYIFHRIHHLNFCHGIQPTITFSASPTIQPRMGESSIVAASAAESTNTSFTTTSATAGMPSVIDDQEYCLNSIVNEVVDEVFADNVIGTSRYGIAGGSKMEPAATATPTNRAERESPWPVILHEVVSSRDHPSIRWSEDGRSFYIKDDAQFEEETLPCLRMSFGEFYATCRRWHFTVLGKYRWSHPYFVRGNVTSLQNMSTNPKKKSTAWRDAKWEANYTKLLKFKAEHGHCKVKTKYSAIGRWVSRQRCRKRKGMLSTEFTSRLDKIGFDWSPQLTVQIDRAHEISEKSSQRVDSKPKHVTPIKRRQQKIKTST